MSTSWKKPPASKGDKQDTGGGCCCLLSLYYAIGLAVAVLFPGTREGRLVKPVVESWEDLFGAPPPAWSLLPVLLASLFVLAGTALGYGVGFLAAKGITRFSSHRTDLQRWGAIASILGLLFSLIALFLR